MQQGGVGALFLGHRLDHGDLALQHFVVHAGVLHLLGHFAHAGHHRHHAFHAAHLEHLFKLHLQVVHVELTLHHALHHLLGLFGLDGFLRLFDQRNDIAHAQNAARDTVRFKGLDGVHLLAQADKSDGLAGDCAHRQCGTTAAVAVHPGQNHTGDADLGVEFLGDFDGDLTGQTIDDQQCLTRGDDIADVFDLLHEHFVDLQTPGRVEHVDVIPTQDSLLFRAFGNVDRFLARHDRQGVHANLGPEHGQLIHRSGAIDVERGHQNLLALFFLQAFCQLTSRGCLTRTLQTHHQDRGRRAVDLQLAGVAFAAQGVDQCVMNDLHDLLAGGHRFGNGLAGRLILHLLDKVARNRQRDVGFKQGDADFAQGSFDVFLRQRALFSEPIKDAGKAFG